MPALLSVSRSASLQRRIVFLGTSANVRKRMRAYSKKTIPATAAAAITSAAHSGAPRKPAETEPQTAAATAPCTAAQTSNRVKLMNAADF